jgi:hypothetical protein
MKKVSYFNNKFILLGLMLIILFINIMYLYLNKSCSDLSPEQQCICYDLEKRNNPKYLDQYKNSCKKFRPLND